ncbi:MAG TPA: FHA domain-containing protein [Candidatus Acidoferrum sp.]|nr:FHA domain-containing protein [Candidatus Acidoferrum sp.]
MIQFNILAGKKAGAQLAARHFPFRIGRAPGNELQLDDAGIWDQHLIVEFDRQQGLRLATAPLALAAVNGKPVETVTLHNGDIITLGSAKLQFWIAAAQQQSLGLREAVVWSLLAAVTAGQFALIYWLLR